MDTPRGHHIAPRSAEIAAKDSGLPTVARCHALVARIVELDAEVRALASADGKGQGETTAIQEAFKVVLIVCAGVDVNDTYSRRTRCNRNVGLRRLRPPRP